MSNALQKIDAGLDDSQIELIKRTICKGATDDELKLFMATANRLGLDPFAKQMYAVKRWSNADKREVMMTMCSIDGFRTIAERTGSYAPGDKTTYTYDDKGNLASATASVKKFVHGTWHTIYEDALWSEYRQVKKDGSLSGLWATMPTVMLAKCAEARALRRAFPMQLSGVYVKEELDQAENDNSTAAAHVMVIAEPAKVLPAQVPAAEVVADAVFLDFDDRVKDLLLDLEAASSINDVAKAASEIAGLKLDKSGPAYSALTAGYRKASKRLEKAAKAAKEAA